MTVGVAAHERPCRHVGKYTCIRDHTWASMTSFALRKASLTPIFGAMTMKPITVAETLPFLRQAADLWREEERNAFVDYIAANPEAGDVIPDTGGVRKVRWSRAGMGKRGGTRVIYFYHDDTMPLYLLLVYAKAQREDLSPDQKQRVRALVTELKQAHRRR